MATELKMTLLLRRAAFADSCVLQLGEPGYHTSTKEFKVGDGSTTWKELPIANKAQIQDLIDASINAHKAGYYTKTEIDELLKALREAITKVANDLAAEVTARQEADEDLQSQIDTKLATETFNTWKGTHENDHAGTATEITAEIAAAVLVEENARKAADKDITDAIGTSADTKDKTTVYGAIKAEADAREQADTTITNKIGDIGTGTVAARLDAADKAASDAHGAANAAGQAIDTHKNDKANPHGVTAAQVGLGNVDNKSVATIKSEFTGSIAENNTGFVTGGDVYAADKALKDRIETIETFFEGAYAEDGKPLTDALDTLQEIQDYVDTHGEAAAQMVKDIKQNADDIDALESIISTGSNNLAGRVGAIETSLAEGGTTNEAIKAAKKAGDDAQTTIDDHKDDENNPHKVTKAQVGLGNVDNKSVAEIKTEFTGAVADGNDKFVTGDAAYDAIEAAKAAVVGGAISGDATAQTVEGAKRYADSQDTALKTAIEGTADDASSVATIAGAKKYAEEKAAAAQSAAEATAAADATSKANAAQANAETKAAELDAALKTELESYADQAETDAIAAVVGTANDTAEDDTIKGLRKAIAAGDSAAVTSANQYTDAQLKAAAAKVKAGTDNEDIIVTPDTTTGETTVAHKTYGTGSYTAPASVQETHFVTGINVSNGHVTGASVKSLAEALSSMVFVLDGGTDANTLVFDF